MIRSQQKKGNEISKPILNETEILSVNVLAKSFSKTGPSVLENIFFQQKHGEVLSILGPSGSGKTTLLRIIAGLDKEFSGNISFYTDKDKAKLSSGLVFQDARLLPWKNVENNISYSLPKSIDKTIQQLRVDKILRLVGLESHRDAWPKELSGGMEKRAALARALVASPRLLMLDEPFGALDAFTRMQLQSELISLRRELGLSVLIVTHDIEEAIFLSDRIIILNGHPTTIQREFSVNMGHPRNRMSSEFEGLRRGVFECVMSKQ